MHAVLSYWLPNYLNEAYAKWEMGLISKVLPDSNTARVLDVGCGAGRVTVPIAQKGFEVVAIDISGEMLNACRENVASSGARNVSVIKCVATNLPFTKEAFHFILCLGLLEHIIPVQRVEILEGISRALKRRGVALIVVNNDQSILLRSDTRYLMKEQQADGYFCGLMNINEITAILKSLGLGVELVGSNLMYSLAKYICSREEFKSAESAASLLASTCATIDLKVPHKGPAENFFADQWLVKAKKP